MMQTHVAITMDPITREGVLFVRANLGPAFVAMPRDVQRREVEVALTVALEDAQDLVDRAPAEDAAA